MRLVRSRHGAWVFAYGSNLSLAQMRRRCPSARLWGPAVLVDHRLAFGGHSVRWDGAVATVLPEPKAEVRGVVYRLRCEDLKVLDVCEGVPRQYERLRIPVRTDTRTTLTPYVYQLQVPYPAVPSPAYLGQIMRAYQDRQWPLEGLMEAALPLYGETL